MRRRDCWMMALLLAALALPGYADNPPADSSAAETPLEHTELTLPHGLLSELPVLDRSLSMQEAVDTGLENSLNLQVAGAETAFREAMTRRARAERWPTLSLGSMTFLRGGRSTVLMTPDMTMLTADRTLSTDLNATARLPLFTGGRIVAGIRAARFAEQGAEALQRQSVVDTAYQIRAAYLQALYSQEEHRVHQAHTAVEQSLLTNAQARYRVGRGLKADVLRIQSEVAESHRMLNEEHNRLSQTLLELKAAMGIDLASRIRLSDTLQRTVWNGPELSDLLAQALEEHPQIQAMERRVREAEAQIRVAKAAYLPQVYGQVTGNLRYPEEAPMMGNGVIGMLNASLPVFDRKRDAEMAQAKAALERASLELKARRLEVAKQLAQAWSEFQYAGENVPLLEAAVSRAEEELRLMRRRYEVGRALQVEVQDAALNLQQKRLDQAKALYTQALAKAKLLQASGRVSESP
jgi:outer membrane protein